MSKISFKFPRGQRVKGAYLKECKWPMCIGHSGELEASLPLEVGYFDGEVRGLAKYEICVHGQLEAAVVDEIKY